MKWSGRTIISIRMLLAIEREQQPELTIEALMDETSEDLQYCQLTLPQPKEWQGKGVTPTYQAH